MNIRKKAQSAARLAAVFAAAVLCITMSSCGTQPEDTALTQAQVQRQAEYTQRGGVTYVSAAADEDITIDRYGAPISVPELHGQLPEAAYFELAYSGSEDADWVLRAECGDISRFFLIKEGRISRELDSAADVHDVSLCGDHLAMTAGMTFYILELGTGRLKQLNDVPFGTPGRFICESPGYIAIETDVVSIYEKSARTLYYKRIPVIDHYCAIDGDDITYRLADGIELTENYSDKKSFLGYTLHISADCKNEDIGSFINERMSVTLDLDPANDLFTVENGCLFSKDKKTLFAVPYDCANEHSFIVPKSAEDEKRDFTVPEYVTRIAKNAFYKANAGRPLSYIYVYKGVSKENVRELLLNGRTKVYRTSGVDESAVNESFEKARETARRFNEPDEYSALIACIEASYGGLYMREGAEISYSAADAENYTDAHLYIYSDGKPVYIAVPLFGEDEAAYPFVMTDSSTRYSIYIDAVDENSRYYSEALALYAEKGEVQ